ncbi:MAG TPA: hypothetical protein ACFYD1_06630 [Candidatus Hypogeohydataceae bacterium YC38]
MTSDFELISSLKELVPHWEEVGYKVEAHESGTIVEWHKGNGQWVKKGDRLCEIRPSLGGYVRISVQSRVEGYIFITKEVGTFVNIKEDPVIAIVVFLV